MNEVVIGAMPGADYQQYPNAVSPFSSEEFSRLGKQCIERIPELAAGRYPHFDGFDSVSRDFEDEIAIGTRVT
jgi:hypothetical protein